MKIKGGRIVIRWSEEARTTYKESIEETSWPKDLEETSIETTCLELK